MKSYKSLLAHTLLDILYFSKIYRLLEPKYQGVGVIFTLHHIIKYGETTPFEINRLLEITPEFLEQTIQQVIELGYDIVSLDEMRRRLTAQDFSRRFVCFTIDDGYRDNYLNAYPIFKKYNIPFAIYINTGITDGTALLWWRCLEKIIVQENRISLAINGQEKTFETTTLVQKQKVFNQLYWHLRSMPLDLQHSVVNTMADKYQLSVTDLCLNCAMTWDMLKEIAQDPLVTIGTHTVNHLALSKLPEQEVINEAVLCRALLNEKLHIDANHFCYPYGDEASAFHREYKIIEQLGFKTATTTRKKVLFADHASYLHSLPRIPLNGLYQEHRYVRLLLSGVPSGLWENAKDLKQSLISLIALRRRQ